MSRSHKTFKGQSTHAPVCAITQICIDGLPSNLVQMLSSLRQCAVTLTSGSVQLWSGSTYQSVRLREKQNILKKPRWGLQPSFGLPCYCLFLAWYCFCHFLISKPNVYKNITLDTFLNSTTYSFSQGLTKTMPTIIPQVVTSLRPCPTEAVMAWLHSTGSPGPTVTTVVMDVEKVLQGQHIQGHRRV